jgi:hypothetical protein
VLAVVLVGVLYMQFGGGGKAEPGNAPAYQPPAAKPPAAARAAVEAPKPQVEKTVKDADAVLTAFDPTRWESPELTTVIAYDPFARPAAFPTPQIISKGEAEVATDAETAEQRAKELAEAVEKLQQQLEQLQQRGVQVIVGGADQGGYVAVIGDRTVHVGDEIDGFTVTAIEPDGVRVEQTEVE